MNDLDFSHDLRELADDAGPAGLDLKLIAVGAARRRHRHTARGAAVTAASVAVALGAATLAWPAVDGRGQDRLAGTPAANDAVGAEITTPAFVRGAIDRADEVPAQDTATGTLLAQSDDGRLRMLGVDGGGRQCIAVFEGDGTVGSLGFTCGTARAVTDLELTRTAGGTGGNVGHDRLSGVLPPGAVAVLLKNGATSKRVPVIDIPAPWNLGAFITPWPVRGETEATAVNAAGQPLLTAHLTQVPTARDE